MLLTQRLPTGAPSRWMPKGWSKCASCWLCTMRSARPRQAPNASVLSGRGRGRGRGWRGQQARRRRLAGPVRVELRLCFGRRTATARDHAEVGIGGGDERRHGPLILRPGGHTQQLADELADRAAVAPRASNGAGPCAACFTEIYRADPAPIRGVTRIGRITSQP